MKIDNEAIDRLYRLISEERSAASPPPPPLPPAPPHATSGGMDPSQSGIEKRVGQTEADIRSLLNRGIFAVVALAAMIGGLYLYINSTVAPINGTLSSLNREVGVISAKLDAVIERQDRMDAKLDTIIERLPQPRK